MLSVMAEAVTTTPCWFGIAGWSYPDWTDCVYPAGCRDTLAFVADYVDCIEINSTFYRPAAPATAAGWVKRTGHLPHFFFTAKLNQQFTHEGRLEAADLQTFKEGLRPIADAGRLKALLAQFSQTFDNRSEHADRLARLRESFPGWPMVLELRHRSWQTPEALAGLQRLDVSVANLDYPASRDAFDLQQCRVGELRYLRLHGRNREAWFDAKAGRDQTYNYLYSADELDAIARRAARLAVGSSGVLTVANNHYQGKELVNALELKARSLRGKVPVPPLLQARYPRLEEIAE